MAQRIVEGRLAPRVHDAVGAVGAVEDVVDVVGRVGDVLNGTGAVKAQLVAALAAVTVVRHNAELKVDRAVGWGEEAGDGDIDLRIGAAAAHGDHRESIKHGQVAHGLQGVLVHDDEHPTAPGGVVFCRDDVGHCVAGVDWVTGYPIRDVGEAAVIGHTGSVEFPFALGFDVDVGVGVVGADFDLVAQVLVGNEPVAEATCPIQSRKADFCARAKAQAVRGGAPRVGVVIPVVVLHVVVVVVGLRELKRQGLLCFRTVEAAAAVHGGVGEELDAAVLLRLKADVKILHDLGRTRCPVGNKNESKEEWKSHAH